MSVISNSDAFPDESPWKKLYQMFMKFLSTSIFENEYWDKKMHNDGYTLEDILILMKHEGNFSMEWKKNLILLWKCRQIGPFE